MSDDRKRAFEAGMNGFLTKPTAPKVLQEEVLRSIQELHSIKSTDPTALNPPDTRNIRAVDLSYLLNLSNGDTAFVTEIMDAFLKETPGALQNLQTYALNQDWESCFKVVHQLKPNFGMMGMKTLEEKTVIIEEYLKKGDNVSGSLSNLIAQLITQATEALPLLTQEKRNLIL
jgi:HPt (histidine-containing phosphotransfer) domain-containing protein